jgi:hypothetical protein
MAKLIKALELEIATSWAIEQQLSNLTTTEDLQLQKMCNKTFWEAYEIIYNSFIIT